MNTMAIGVRMRTVTAVVLGMAVVACKDTQSVAEPLFESESESAAAEALLDEATLSLASMEQNMESEVDAERDRERERERDRVRDGVVDRRPDHRPFPDRVGLVVEFAESAVSLASRILDEQGATPPQLALLSSAEEFLRKAETALAGGDPGHAVAFAEKACWTALKAVVIPGGVSVEEARMIYELAEELLESAWAEVQAGDDRLESVVFGWAVQFFQVGSAQLEEGEVRAVAPLWKSAILSAWILG
jgi:hypothetical protein